MEVAGSVALVTGANRGIGASIVDALVSAGAARVHAAMRDPRGWRHADGRVVPIALDITDPARIAQVAGECPDVSILVNNAGVLSGGPLLAASRPEAAEEEMRVNYFGTLAMCRAFAPALARNGGGAIVNVLSILARVSAPRVGSYSASKAAAFSLTQAIRGELAGRGTLVVGVMPGFVDTDMAKRIALPKLAPSAVADAIVDALQSGTEDVYPGEAATVARGLAQDPKSVEREFARLFGVA